MHGSIDPKINIIMDIALSTARAKTGLTGDNPSVCAIATNDDFEIIEIATTEYHGRPHAEKILIQKLINLPLFKEKLNLFVTLEPCSHVGRTGSCAEEIIKSSLFKMVYVATIDKDQRVMGEGIKKISDAGIGVQVGVGYEVANNKNYLQYQFSRENNRPWITAKIAMSLDGKIATHNMDSKWISSNLMRGYTNFARHLYGGILVGRSTYERDHPHLGCRTHGLESFSPAKFVLSSKSIDVADGFCNIVSKDGNLVESVKEIYRDFKINHLLIEGGAKTIGSFIEYGLVNEIIVIKSPIIIGDKGIDSVVFNNKVDFVSELKRFCLCDTKIIDNDIILRYEL
jgi:diaminohydroxyphosphoribosylaminopyrimidine deaminase/5-amino-6-(5-phosphoribosylamino)uracil reductase